MSQNLQNEEHVKNTGFYSVTLLLQFCIFCLQTPVQTWPLDGL